MDLVARVSANAPAFVELAKYVNDFDWTLLEEQYRDAHYGRSTPDITKYKCFMFLKLMLGDYNAAVLSPFNEIDSIWHTHLLMPVNYAKFCSGAPVKEPRIVDHNPSGWRDERAQKRRSDRARAIMKQIFDEDDGEEEEFPVLNSPSPSPKPKRRRSRSRDC